MEPDQTFTDQIGVRLYCIRNSEGLYWCNTWGFITVVDDQHSSYEVFTEAQKEIFNLPIGGHWEII